MPTATESPLSRAGFDADKKALKSWMSESYDLTANDSTSLATSLESLRNALDQSRRNMERESAFWMELLHKEEQARIKEKQTKEVRRMCKSTLSNLDRNVAVSAILVDVHGRALLPGERGQTSGIDRRGNGGSAGQSPGVAQADRGGRGEDVQGGRHHCREGTTISTIEGQETFLLYGG